MNLQSIPAMKVLDRRLNAMRPDLADLRLKGVVEAQRFVEGARASIVSPVIDIRRGPDHAAPIDSQILFGETIKVFERSNGWAWIQRDLDNYVGYVPEEAIAAPRTATHHIVSPRVPLFDQLDGNPIRYLSVGSLIAITKTEREFSQTTEGDSGGIKTIDGSIHISNVKKVG